MKTRILAFIDRFDATPFPLLDWGDLRYFGFRWTLRKERWWPTVAAIGAFSAGYCFGTTASAEPLLFSATVTFGAIVAGFTGTCLSILIALDTGVMRTIRRNKIVFSILAKYLGHTVFSGVFASVVGIAGLLVPTPDETTANQPTAIAQWIFPCWCAAVAYCFSCFCRLAIIMLRVFSHADATPTGSQ